METKVAIACQGGGAHAAFTAGVLDRLLEEMPQGTTIWGLSGTSGGALTAACAWRGLIGGGPKLGRDLLRAVWEENAAQTFLELLWNTCAVASLEAPLEWKVGPSSGFNEWVRGSWEGFAAAARTCLGFSPLAWPVQRRCAGELRLRSEFLSLRELVERHLDLPSPADQQRSRPRLLVGAVDVASGDFKAFDSEKGEIETDALLASAAVPMLFDAVSVRGTNYWDGLLSQNPPIRNFFADTAAAEKPDEIWVVQINPSTCELPVRTAAQIIDRRNELAGNVSLEQELRCLKTVNKLVTSIDEMEKGVQGVSRPPEVQEYKPVRFGRIQMDEDHLRNECGLTLDYASKLDRAPSFLDCLKEHGRRRAEEFLGERALVPLPLW